MNGSTKAERIERVNRLRGYANSIMACVVNITENSTVQTTPPNPEHIWVNDANANLERINEYAEQIYEQLKEV